MLDAKRLNRELKALRSQNQGDAASRLADEVALRIVVRSESREWEVEARYTCDEVSISLLALFPLEYPLKGVAFEWKESCGLPAKKLKNWQMLRRGMINNSNATLAEAVMLLAINIGKHYEGMDECPICYSVVHPSKKTLPKVKCQTCRGKFHRYCIYKWTKTSQKSSCPLCRSLI